MKPKISVVIINFENWPIINEVINAVLAQTLKPSQIILVDDCSSDNCIQKIKNKFPQLEILKTKTNSGPGAARNLGFSKAKHSFVLHIDGDVILERDALKKLVTASTFSPGITFLVPIITYNDRPSIIQKAGTPHHYLGFTLVDQKEGSDVNAIDRSNVPIHNFAGCCYLVNKSSREIEMFDPQFYYSLEELDFCARNFLLHDHRSLLVASTKVTHQVGSTEDYSQGLSKKYSSKRFFQVHRNRWFYLLKNYQLKTLLLIFPLLIIVEGALVCFSFVAFRDKLVIFRSYKSIILNANHLIKQRNDIQSRRIQDDSAWLRSEQIKFKHPLFTLPITSKLLSLLDFLIYHYGKIILRLK